MKKERAKKVGSLKLEPLKGRFFDIKPASKGNRGPVFAWMKDYSRFALISFLAFLALSFGNAYIEGRHVVFESSTLAYAGYEELQQGIDHLLKQDGQSATKSFLEAQKTFEALKETTAPFIAQSGDFVKHNDYTQTADRLIQVALDVSKMGQKLASFSNSLKELPKDLLAKNEEEDVLIELIHQKKGDLKQILDLAIDLQHELVQVNVDVLPESLKPRVSEAQNQIGQFLSVLMNLNQLTDHLLTLLGDRVPHRYLILLQNNHELRATGGFIGSYMIVDVNDGIITRMEASDIYASDGWLSKLIPAPAGINQVSKYWYMRDANYSPDFPTSAEKIMWFLEQSRGPSIDTVIAIDQTVVEGLLEIMGDIQLEGFPMAIDSENFNQVISFYTEAKLSQTNTPKQLLFDLIPRFKEKLTPFEDAAKILAIASKMIEEGHIQLYSRNPDLQMLFDHYGLSGRVTSPQEKLDYLNVVSTSIGGNKTDEFMRTRLDHSTFVDASGMVVDELTIEKKHTFNDENRAEIQALIDEFGTGELVEGDLKYILGEGKNVDYMRVYVPLGSELEEVSGLKRSEIDISEDLGYTVFGFNYGPISPGEGKEILLKYRLPFELDISPVDNYRFVAQKQAGVEQVTLRKTLKMPKGVSAIEAYPEPKEGLNVPTLEGDFDGVKIFMAAISAE